MESTVEALNNAYMEFVGAITDVLIARELAEGHKTAATDAALEAFKERWELFRCSCDQAEEFVGSVKKQIMTGLHVDKTTGNVPAFPGRASSGMTHFNEVGLQQIRKALRRQVPGLQKMSGAAAQYASRFSKSRFFKELAK